MASRENLTSTVAIRLTADEAAALTLLAEAEDRSVSAYLRRMIRLALDESLAEWRTPA